MNTELDAKLVTHLDARSPGAEAYRVLRTNLQFTALDQPLRTLLITSSAPAEGKSLTAANLSIAFAQAGQRVLLVDADLRRPTVHKLFGLQRAWSGLTTLLAAGSRLEDMVHEVEVPNLHVLPSGPVPPNPAEILGSVRMGEFLEEARAAYDLVVLDSPPVLAVTDPCVLARRVDGVALVTRVGKVGHPQAQRAKVALEAVHARLLGVILDGITLNDASNGYSYYYYGENR